MGCYLFYTHRYVGNACGTIGLLHAVGNCRDAYQGMMAPDCYLSKLFNETKEMNAEEIGKYIENDDEIEEVHVEQASRGETEAKMDVDSHFIAFVCVDGDLYELDGRKDTAINHGPCERENLLPSAAVVIKQFMVFCEYMFSLLRTEKDTFRV